MANSVKIDGCVWDKNISVVALFTNFAQFYHKQAFAKNSGARIRVSATVVEIKFFVIIFPSKNNFLHEGVYQTREVHSS